MLFSGVKRTSRGKGALDEVALDKDALDLDALDLRDD